MRLFVLYLLILGAAIAASGQDQVIFFSDSPNGNILYDASWGYRKSPSELELAGLSDKFPVETENVFSGAHSLRLHWTSRLNGDWGIAIASPGWPAHDFTQFDSLVYRINSPVSIVRDVLPDLAIEDTGDKKSSRLWLGDYLQGVDGDVSTWQKVAVPLVDFKPGQEQCDLTKIKTVFHYQKSTDAEEHIAWIDEVLVIKDGNGDSTPPVAPVGAVAAGHDSRIDIKWIPNAESDLKGYYVYRAASVDGPFTRITPVALECHVFSDFIGTNDVTYYYYVTAVNNDYLESEPGRTVSAKSVSMTDEELLTSVQEITFRYFYDYGYPVSGLVRERKGSGNTCTSGGTGFGLMTIMIGAERGFISREEAAVRIVTILRFLQDKADRFHGAWSHWIDGRTGDTIPFSTYDDGGDIVETAYVVQALLTIRQYFTLENETESEIRDRATQMWREVEWDWYRKSPPEDRLYWHWSLNHGWRMNMAVVGFNEAMIVYLLAVASPTHNVPASLFKEGWAGSGSYRNGNSYYGFEQFVGPPMGGPLFFTHYSFLGFDPRNQDEFCNYFENNRQITQIHRAYCTANPGQHTGYGPLVWGLTASDDPWGYSAHDPQHDNGTITPTAAISAMPYTPEISIQTLRHLYHTYGDRLWGEFGFRDAFNLDQNWFATSYLAIDQGTIVPMIENHRTRLCWNLFMSNPEIEAMLDDIGFVRVDADSRGELEIHRFELGQNYPNPFNPSTVIYFTLNRPLPVTLEVFNLLGESVATLLNGQKLSKGSHHVTFDAGELSSGLYFYRLQTDNFCAIKKMIVMR